MGNHEYYGYYEEDDFSFEIAQKRFLHFTRMKSIYFQVRAHGYPCFFLSTEGYHPDWRDAGFLSEAQLSWFHKELHKTPPGPVFVFFHQPINDTVAESVNTCLQSNEMHAILKNRPGTLFITGHTHCRMDRADQLVLQDGTLFVGGGCAYGEFPQSRWFEMRDGRLKISIRDHRTQNWLTEWDASVEWTANQLHLS
jgi:3',5'-cyclic-AMP phosphodiesterase